jgi:hypothetical protein
MLFSFGDDANRRVTFGGTMGFLAGRQCYLSGAIENGDGPNWRIEPSQRLSDDFGINVFDPFIDPKQQWAVPLRVAREQCDYDEMERIATDFVGKDLSTVTKSDLLIAYLPFKVATTGTTHEIIEAVRCKMPVLLVCPQGKQFNPLWYFGFIKHHYMFGSWEELYAYLAEVDAGNMKHHKRWRLIYGMI